MLRIDCADFIKCALMLIGVVLYISFMFALPMDLLYVGVKESNQRSLIVGTVWLSISILATMGIFGGITWRRWQQQKTYQEYEEL